MLKPQSNPSIASLEPAAAPDTSPLFEAKPVLPVSWYPCELIQANHYIDFPLRPRHGDGSCVSGGIDSQSVIFDVIFL
jgi:hypothetical protein